MKAKILVRLLFLFTFSLSNAVIALQLEQPLEHKEVVEIVRNTAIALEQNYLVPDKADDVASALRAKLTIGKFDQVFDFERLQYVLRSIIIDITADNNFSLVKRSSLAPTGNQMTPEHIGIIDAQVLDKNIGFVALKGDFVFDDARQAFTDAVAQVSGTNALIIDLRKAGLGTVELAQHVISFFVKPDTNLAQITFGREAPQRLVSATISDTPSTTQDVPVFILTSSFVSGPWEFVAFSLKHLNRATIVGEETMGLGKMTIFRPVSKHAGIVFSYAEIKLDANREGWHKWGVMTDYQTSADASLETAYQLATQMRKRR